MRSILADGDKGFYRHLVPKTCEFHITKPIPIPILYFFYMLGEKFNYLNCNLLFVMKIVQVTIDFL